MGDTRQPQTAADYHAAISANVDAMYEGSIAFEAFHRENCRLWDLIDKADLTSDVLKMIRDDKRPGRRLR